MPTGWPTGTRREPRAAACPGHRAPRNGGSPRRRTPHPDLALSTRALHTRRPHRDRDARIAAGRVGLLRGVGLRGRTPWSVGRCARVRREILSDSAGIQLRRRPVRGRPSAAAFRVAVPIIDPIFDFVRREAGAERPSFCLYGHSAGGQFVHRLVSLAWSPRIELAISANAGSYSLPRFDVDYPFGLGGTGLSPSALPDLLVRPLVVLVGDRDNDPQHRNLPRHPEAMRQGPHRYARGRHYVDAARQAAATAGVALCWRLAVAPGVGHSNAGMAPFAARLCAGIEIETPQG